MNLHNVSPKVFSLAQYAILLSWLLSLPKFPQSQWSGLVRPIKGLFSPLPMLFSDNGLVFCLSFQCVSTHWQQSGGTQQFIITPFRYSYWIPSTVSPSFLKIILCVIMYMHIILQLFFFQSCLKGLGERQSIFPAIPHIHNSSQYRISLQSV